MRMGRHTLNPNSCTLHPTPYTLHPTPCTPRPTPHTLHPTPLNLTPTLNPKPYTRCTGGCASCFFFFFITLEPRVVLIHQSMCLKYEPSSEPLRIPDKQLFLHQVYGRLHSAVHLLRMLMAAHACFVLRQVRQLPHRLLHDQNYCVHDEMIKITTHKLLRNQQYRTAITTTQLILLRI